jgi:hypothetical protein
LRIVKCGDARRLVMLPKGLDVERTFAWISRNRRLARASSATPDRRRFLPPRHDPGHAAQMIDKPLRMNPPIDP